MSKSFQIIFFIFFVCSFFSCSKSSSDSINVNKETVSVVSSMISNKSFLENIKDVYNKSLISIKFSKPIDESTVTKGFKITDDNEVIPNYSISLSNNDSTVNILLQNVPYLTRYKLTINSFLKSKSGGMLNSDFKRAFTTSIDSSRKFPEISDEQLLTKVQQQTFKYFWDFAHPVSGLARERNTSGDVVTTGGSGFGLMAIIVGMERKFIAREDGLNRVQKIVAFLKDEAATFHGAYPHWLNGNTGEVIPFSANDNGADLVETSFLVQGLIAVREYFKLSTKEENTLRNDINTICNKVEWNWFTQSQNVLYWHWSPDKSWTMNLKIQGWNECLITYVLASASKNYSISKTVYDNGWTKNGTFKNGNIFYNYVLPLGENLGGPLFFEHYSFMGLNPQSLKDKYADYFVQTKNHTLINYSYCVDNPKEYYGYSDSVWGLTASDIKGGYAASSPNNDLGVVAPTAALSSFPYTPEQSMAALHFYYYVLGDKLFKEYGFIDAFSLHDIWFADSFLAIDQGPIIVMIENYRTGLLWNLVSNAPEIRTALASLEFSSD